MERTALRLKIPFYAALLAVVVVVVLFETGLIAEGVCASEKRMEYFTAVAVELFALLAIPLSLRMFKFGSIRRRLYAGREHALSVWGTVRILLLGIPMCVSTVLYYLFMNPSFGYIAVILFISMLFIYPSTERCVQETSARQKD
ncbi:MAG: hypothetical protein J5637_02145 [Prevotella sp.]|nr:hypothetical protein [Prevotella sp.]